MGWGITIRPTPANQKVCEHNTTEAVYRPMCGAIWGVEQTSSSGLICTGDRLFHCQGSQNAMVPGDHASGG